MSKKYFRIAPVVSSLILFIFAEVLTFLVIHRINPFLVANNIIAPSQPPQTVTIIPGPVTLPSGEVTQVPAYSSAAPIMLYFLGTALVLGIVLFLLPVSILKLLLRGLFAFLFCYGTFVILILWLPMPVTIGITAAAGLAWFIVPRIWLHNLLMIMAMVAVGSIFGHMVTPWTALLLLLALAIYDFLAVRFGYMVWMAGKMSDTNALPAFIIPKRLSDWGGSIKQTNLDKLAQTEPSERDYAILGGGDVGFSLLLISSVYFAHESLSKALIMAVFTLLGLLAAYVIQAKFLKGRAMPALPPIAVFAFVGLLLVR